MSLSNESTMVMPVAPAYQGGYGYGNGCGSMWGGDWASWIILFLIFGMFGGNGWGAFGGFGGRNGAGCCQPPKVSRHTVTAIFTRRLQAKTHPPCWTSLTASCPPSVSQRPGLTATSCAKSETYEQSPAC